MLPELDGFELVRRIRSESEVPIILLTARGEETKRVAGLEIGADDYVVKPFSMAEVIARVGAQLRPAAGFQPSGPLRHGRLELDERARRTRVSGDQIELTRREFDLLAALLREPDHAHSRDSLLDLVWGSSYVSPKTVDVHIAALRRKLGDDVQITALRGVGYRLEA